MDRSTLVETLVMSEKNHSIVKIKTVKREKPIVGAVQKVLNQIIILKPVAADAITVTFGDIESVNKSRAPLLVRLLQNVCKTLYRR